MTPTDRRRCPRCCRDLPVDEFGWRDRERRRRQSYCGACQNSAWRAWYRKHENRERHLELVAARRRRRVQTNRALVEDAKAGPCSDCGRTFPTEAMDLDHVHDPKAGDISRMIYTVGPKRLGEEIAKCEPVCAVCHRLRTRARRYRASSDER